MTLGFFMGMAQKYGKRVTNFKLTHYRHVVHIVGNGGCRYQKR